MRRIYFYHWSPQRTRCRPGTRAGRSARQAAPGLRRAQALHPALRARGGARREGAPLRDQPTPRPASTPAPDAAGREARASRARPRCWPPPRSRAAAPRCEEINRGGRIAGTTLNVYSLLPEPGGGAGATSSTRRSSRSTRCAGRPAASRSTSSRSTRARPGGRDGAREAAVALREAVADPQVIAVIGPAGSDTGPRGGAAAQRGRDPRGRAGRGLPRLHGGAPRRAGPLAALRPHHAGAPDRRRRRPGPGDRPRRRGGDGRAAPRITVEQEPGPAADALVDALRDAGAELEEDPARADAFAYAGEDPRTPRRSPTRSPASTRGPRSCCPTR